MSYRIRASAQAPVMVYAQDGGAGPSVAVDYDVRVYAPRRGGAWVRVHVLDGAREGLTGWVRNTDLGADGSELASRTEGNRLFAILAQEQFTTGSGARVAIPYKYPVDGCFARAQIMTQLLDAAGYTVDKIFIVLRKGLRVTTEFGGDMPDYGTAPEVSWWYHVAPVVYLKRQNTNEIEAVVLDPSVARGATSVVGWIAASTPGEFVEMTYDEMRQRLLHGQPYPTAPAKAWVVRTSREVYSLPAEASPANSFLAHKGDANAELERTAARVPEHDVVAHMYRLVKRWDAAVGTSEALRNSPTPYPEFATERDALILRIRALPKQARDRILTGFPTLLTDYKGTFLGTGVEPGALEALQALRA